MRTYNYLANELPRELIELYNDMQTRLMGLIVKKLKDGESPERVFSEILNTVSNYNPQIEKVLTIIFNDAKKKVVKDGEKEFKADEPNKPVQTGEANAIVQPLITSAMAILLNLNSKLVSAAYNEYSNDYSYLQAPGTRLARQEQKFNQVVKSLAVNGFKIYEPSGRQVRGYSIENILRRDAMYRVNQVNNEISMENFEKSGARFIEVSSHPTARTWNKYQKQPYEDHSSWQGKVYYSGIPIAGYEEFETTCGYGELLGIGGINCYHQFTLNYDGETTETQYSKKEVEKNYALSQEQRAYEREIRKLKQAQEVYASAGDNVTAGKISRTIRDKQYNLKSFCDRNNLKYYNWRTEI